MKKAKIYLWIFFIVSLLFIILLSFVVHELVHFAQDDFNSKQLCFFGISTLEKNAFLTDGGLAWCGHTENISPVILEEHYFNDTKFLNKFVKDTFEVEALTVQFIFLIFLTILVSTMFVKIYKKIKK